VTPRHAPQDVETSRLITRLRDRTVPENAAGATVYVGEVDPSEAELSRAARARA
jgi:hypothetical protein